MSVKVKLKKLSVFTVFILILFQTLQKYDYLCEKPKN